MNDKTRRVLEAVTKVIVMKDVQPGSPDANGRTHWDNGSPVTWCNRALHRILVMLGGQVDLILEPKGINWTNANAMVKNARENCQRVEKPEDAQNLANMGHLVIAVAHNPRGSGHVEMVVFDDVPFQAARGPRVGGAGTVNGIGYVRPRFASLDVEFYEIPTGEGVAD